MARCPVKHIRDLWNRVMGWRVCGDRIEGEKNFSNFTTWREPPSCGSHRACCLIPVWILRTGRIIAVWMWPVSTDGVFVGTFSARCVVSGFFIYLFFTFLYSPLQPTAVHACRIPREYVHKNRNPSRTVGTLRPSSTFPRARTACSAVRRVENVKTGRSVDRKFIAGIRSKAFRGVLDRVPERRTVVWSARVQAVVRRIRQTVFFKHFFLFPVLLYFFLFLHGRYPRTCRYPIPHPTIVNGQIPPRPFSIVFR